METNSIEKKGKSKKINKIFSLLFIAILTFITLGIILNSKVKKWDEKVYPGINAYGVDLTGLSKKEAMDILEKELISKIDNKKIIVKINGENFELSYSKINPVLDIENAAKEAVNYGKDKNIFQKYNLINKNEKINIDVNINYEIGNIEKFEKKIAKKVQKPFSNADIKVKGDEIEIIPEVYGEKVDINKLHDEIIKSINADINNDTTITFELEKETPKILAENLKAIDAVVASYSGGYTGGDSGRITNMEIATEYINGTILMPGDEFSFNKVVGETTPERGFALANTYVGSEVVPGYGGGVCQISTYLYRAAMRANLRPTLRFNHNMMVGYAEASLDATVYEGDIDYRFKNTYDFPIYIQGYMDSSQIAFKILGNKEGFGNKTYDMVNVILDTYKYKTIYEDDPTKEEGYEKVKMNGTNGHKSQGYLVTYENGVEVNSELISTDIYQPLNSIVIRGTKKPDIKEEKPIEKPKPDTNSNTNSNSNNNNNTEQQENSNENTNQEENNSQAQQDAAN